MVKRYNYYSRFDDNGEFVTYSDYAELQASADELKTDRDRLAALLAASQSPDPVTNADSCQPARTYEDGARDAAAVAISVIEDQFPGALYASNRTKCIALIKEKSHE